MTQFHIGDEWKVLDMSYVNFMMLLNTTPLPETDFEDKEEKEKQVKNKFGFDDNIPIGTTSMLDYYNR